MASKEKWRKMTYTLRFPFKLAPGQDIKGLAESIECTVDGLTWRFERKLGFYLLKVIGLDSEVVCHEYLKSLWAGFNWLLLKRGVAVEASLDFDTVTYVTDPEAAARNLERSFGIPYEGPVDGLVNENMPAAYPSHKHILVAAVGTPTVVISTSFEDIVGFLLEGMKIRTEGALGSDPKLQIALDLYAAFWYERSQNAKLLTLVLALESLMTPPPRHKVVVEFLDKWKPEVEARKREFPSETDEYHALEALERELLFKKTDSLRKQIRSLVLKSATYLGYDTAEELAKKAVWVYDKRSILVHEGLLPATVLSEATASAKKITELVLEARFRGYNGTT